MAPGTKNKFGTPLFEPEVSRKQMYWTEESTCDIAGTFRRPGNCAPLPPLVTPLVQPKWFIDPKIMSLSWSGPHIERHINEGLTLNGLLLIIIIIIFYCGLMVHITDTRAQKVVSYTSAHITETVFAHDQHWEKQSTLSSPQLYRHSQEHRKW